MGFLKRIWDEVTFKNLGGEDSEAPVAFGVPTANDFRQMTPSQPFVYTPPPPVAVVTETTFEVCKPLRLTGTGRKSI